jgi:hypothetical protein
MVGEAMTQIRPGDVVKLGSIVLNWKAIPHNRVLFVIAARPSALALGFEGTYDLHVTNGQTIGLVNSKFVEVL